MNRIFSINLHRFSSFFLSLVFCLILVACTGGSSDSSGGGAVPPEGSNIVNVSVDSNVFGAVNEPFVNVTVCSTSNIQNCITIDHILVDTGSVGLRIFAQPITTDALTTLNLTPQTASGYPVGECAQFVQGNTWGPLMFANIQIGGKTANNAVIQIIADSTFLPAPSACTNTGALMDTPATFGANGVLGIGVALQDCGLVCVLASNMQNYYFSCPPTGCNNIGMPLANQIQNTVSLFSSDNNGIILSLNSVPSGGAVSATGTLTFGIDTASNNVSANTNIILVNGLGTFTTTFQGQTYANSYLDSGSNGLYFSPPSNGAIPFCNGSGDIIYFYCPSSTLSFTAQIAGPTGSTSAAIVNFNIANANVLFSKNYAVFNDLGGSTADISNTQRTFDWGLPFFLGRSVYVVFENAQTSKGSGPYFGF